MRTNKIAFGLAAFLALAATASAQEGEPKNDLEFTAKAIACQVTEVKVSEMAVKQAKNEEVKKLAQKMVEDHTKLRDRFMEKAKEMKLAVVEGLEKDARSAYDRLSKLEGDNFDKEYLKWLVESHEKAVTMSEKWSKTAKDDGLRSLAGDAAKGAKEHLEHIKKLSSSRKDG